MGWFNRFLSGTDNGAADAIDVNSRLIDVRSCGEFAGGHIDGAFNLPLDELAGHIASAIPDKATPLLLCCQSGMRSAQACTLLRQLGYTQVSNGGGVGALALRLDRPIRRNC
jgi:phage shock protein E